MGIEKRTKSVFVCGAGHQGLSMAAHLALKGIDVSLWNRTYENIASIIDTKEIKCDGVVRGTAKINKVSCDIKDVISDFVMVTVPSMAHKDIAKTLAPFVHKDMVIVLNPGRTFGALEFKKTLLECGVKELPHIAETQTIVYTCRKSSDTSVTIFALKNGVRISAEKDSDIDYIMSKMPECLFPFFTIDRTMVTTSLSNVGMILHCAPVLMNIGWIETNKADFKYYYNGISKTVAKFLEKMDSEKVKVANAIGVDIETTAEWLRRTYDIEGEDLYSCIQNNSAYEEIDAPKTINTRYILEDVPNGLVPVEYLGKELGIKTPNITTIIDLASSIFDIDFRFIGRKFGIKEIKGDID